MKDAYSGKPGTDWQLATGPFVFSGPPDACLGEVELTNLSHEKQKIRTLDTTPNARPGKEKQPLPACRLQLGARLPPGFEGALSARLELDRTTPPGHYGAEIKCGSRKAKLDITVAPHHELLIEPTHIRLRGASKDTLTAELTLTNHGNLAVPLDDVAMVWLREQDWIGRTLVDTLRSCDPKDDYETFANNLLQQFRQDQLQPVRISFQPSRKEPLAPGETLQRQLSLTLPAGLQKGRHYRGFIKIGEDRIWLELYCNGSAVSEKRRAT